MVDIIATLKAQRIRSAGDPTVGALRVPMPEFEPSEWVASPYMSTAWTTIGQDHTSIYVTDVRDSGTGDTVVYRVSAKDGSGELIAGGFSSQRSYGKVYLALPLGDQDVILFGRWAIARVRGDQQVWRITLSDPPGVMLADAAALTGDVVTVMYQAADYSNSRPQYYRVFSFPVDTPPTTTSMGGWTNYPIDWDAIESAEEYSFDTAAILAAVAPAFDYGMAVRNDKNSDMWYPYNRVSVVGAYVDAGKPTVRYYAAVEVAFPTLALFRVTANATVEGGTIKGTSEVMEPLGLTTNDLPLPPLEPGETDWYVGYDLTFGLSFAPKPFVAFWTAFNRAEEFGYEGVDAPGPDLPVDPPADPEDPPTDPVGSTTTVTLTAANDAGYIGFGPGYGSVTPNSLMIDGAAHLITYMDHSPAEGFFVAIQTNGLGVQGFTFDVTGDLGSFQMEFSLDGVEYRALAALPDGGAIVEGQTYNLTFVYASS